MKLWVLLAAVIGVSGLAVWAAQQPQTPPTAPPSGPTERADEPARITVDVTRVQMLFTVQDKHGRFVTDLGRDDFEVFENKRPQRIQEFTAESDLPLRLAILIDTSNSIRERFRFEQDAAVEFLKSVMKSRADKAMIVSFDTKPELVTDLIDNPDRLEDGIRRLRAGGGTALYDAIYYACRDKLAMDQPRHKFRRAMVVVSDGDDNQSDFTRDQALEMAQKADVVIYAISTNISRAETDGDKVLRYLTQETGGQAFFPFKVEDLSQSFENIANQLTHQYNLLYRPEPLVTDGLWHTVQLRVRGRKDLQVRCRTGYYAMKM
ncbi:MAG TPA: VWA domain-containing protein [Bryobacteraceae bacterium]|nr:VWA domain-containing protein [Bryobacteraceae bacterium]